jgi:hypothetical protein
MRPPYSRRPLRSLFPRFLAIAAKAASACEAEGRLRASNFEVNATIGAPCCNAPRSAPIERAETRQRRAFPRVPRASLTIARLSVSFAALRANRCAAISRGRLTAQKTPSRSARPSSWHIRTRRCKSPQIYPRRALHRPASCSERRWVNSILAESESGKRCCRRGHVFAQVRDRGLLGQACHRLVKARTTMPPKYLGRLGPARTEGHSIA